MHKLKADDVRQKRCITWSKRLWEVPVINIARDKNAFNYASASRSNWLPVIFFASKHDCVRHELSDEMQIRETRNGQVAITDNRLCIIPYRLLQINRHLIRMMNIHKHNLSSTIAIYKYNFN